MWAVITLLVSEPKSYCYHCPAVGSNMVIRRNAFDWLQGGGEQCVRNKKARVHHFILGSLSCLFSQWTYDLTQKQIMLLSNNYISRL